MYESYHGPPSFGLHFTTTLFYLDQLTSGFWQSRGSRTDGKTRSSKASDPSPSTLPELKSGVPDSGPKGATPSPEGPGEPHRPGRPALRPGPGPPPTRPRARRRPRLAGRAHTSNGEGPPRPRRATTTPDAPDGRGRGGEEGPVGHSPWAAATVPFERRGNGSLFGPGWSALLGGPGRAATGGARVTVRPSRPGRGPLPLARVTGGGAGGPRPPREPRPPPLGPGPLDGPRAGRLDAGRPHYGPDTW